MPRTIGWKSIRHNHKGVNRADYDVKEAVCGVLAYRENTDRKTIEETQWRYFGNLAGRVKRQCNGKGVTIAVEEKVDAVQDLSVSIEESVNIC